MQIIANNSGHEPAVGARFRNKMSVNMATDFIKKCMEGAYKIVNIRNDEKFLQSAGPGY